MPQKKVHPATFEEYSAQYPPEVQRVLARIRATIKKAAPGATEKMSYHMPAFELNGNLVWFGAFKHHIGFYPKQSAIEAFKDEAAPYEHEKGTLQFPLDQPIPYELITKLVKFRVAENRKA